MEPEEKDKETIYKIYDSQGLTGYNEKDEYIFAIKTGVIDKNANFTDQEVAELLKTANEMIVKYGIATLVELKSNITVTSWNWESGYGGSASGKGIVKNNSDFNLPELKYTITYYDRDGNQITTDDGYVTYDELSAGDSKSFTFYTSYVGNANTANIALDFDTDMIIKYVANKDYTGNEYKDFLESLEKEDKGLTKQ